MVYWYQLQVVTYTVSDQRIAKENLHIFSVRITIATSFVGDDLGFGREAETSILCSCVTSESFHLIVFPFILY